MDEILRCIDPLGREIVLSVACWYDHVLPEHDIMDGYESSVETALTDPFRIMDDAKLPDRENFYRHRTHPKRPRWFVKVCVEFQPPDRDGAITGRVVTAYLTDRFVLGEQQLWP